MKRKAALFIATIALLLLGCLPTVVDPPEPPILTMTQQQVKWQADRKNHGTHVVDANQPPSGFVYVGAE